MLKVGLQTIEKRLYIVTFAPFLVQKSIIYTLFMQKEIHSGSARASACRKHTSTSMKHFSTHLPRHILMAFAVLGIILVYTSCDTGSKTQSYKTSTEAINAYASFLSEMRSKDNVPSDKLIADVSAWRTIRDSVIS